jgi:hypothetical protein
VAKIAEIAAVVHVGQHHLELVASQAADLGARRDDPLEALRDLLEQLVARGWPSVSLTCLKRSRSSIISAQLRLAAW